MKQITVRIENELNDDLDSISKEMDRSINYVVVMLLQQAIREKKRKRKVRENGEKEKI